ncbi:MAG: glycogen debranching protein GlgX [Candidatus Endonucleobacter sp. (ex Gigantidas childressi)]|nr:glycogen debranching protein GlgX [Candidatus Endonucleobacter sp. (ex Gigantidas childressi)]
MCRYSLHHPDQVFQGARFFPAQRLKDGTVVSGVQFGLKSIHASKVELCLFDSDDKETRIAMPWCQHYIWYVFVEGIDPEQKYGYRVDGPWNPQAGMRFNSFKLLIDPYTQKLDGSIKWSSSLYDYTIGDNGQWLYNKEDSASCMPRSVIVDNQFDWGEKNRPRYKMAESIIYELNVRGFTMTHPDIPESLRGTYLGMCQLVVMDYLKSLGITAVELLPINSGVTEERLDKLGLRNYWGYNPLAFMAPENTMAVSDAVTEFKTMVKSFHDAGIEVIMDMVFNHTAESGNDGPLLSYRGIDNLDYYLLDEKDPTVSINHSGCGNTLRVDRTTVMKLILDSLRHWVEEYHIDGFRFDLAPILGRRNWHFDKYSSFFQALEQDPVLCNIKLIAEPWDLAPDGYQLGCFPHRWSEWNDRYRDCTRAFWRGEHGLLGQIAERLCGSADIFQGNGRHPSSSINYICSHDGFTLNDLVSYSEKNNKDNCENNKDGDNHNFSWNCGHEGETDCQDVMRLRERYKRSLLATLMLSNGALMLQAGDEFGNSQQGNNNAYCQDNEIGWLDWSWLHDDAESSLSKKRLQQFTSGLIRGRRESSRFAMDHFIRGVEEDPENHEVLWRSQHGAVMKPKDWADPALQTICLHWLGVTGKPCDCDFIIFLNASHKAQHFTLPKERNRRERYQIMDTSVDEAFNVRILSDDDHEYTVESHSVVVLQDYCHPFCPMGKVLP